MKIRSRVLGHEIRLILGIIRTPFVVDLELALGGFEPLQGFTFQNYGELALRVRLKFLDRVKASRKTAEGYFDMLLLSAGDVLQSTGCSPAAAV